jgi:hypothetical protein
VVEGTVPAGVPTPSVVLEKRELYEPKNRDHKSPILFCAEIPVLTGAEELPAG